MKIAWNFFAKRRGHDLSRMLQEGRFSNYADYAKWCDSKSVVPLSENEFKLHQPVKPKPSRAKKKKSPGPAPVKKETKTAKEESEQGKTDSGNKPKSRTSSRRRRTPAVKKS